MDGNEEITSLSTYVLMNSYITLTGRYPVIATTFSFLPDPLRPHRPTTGLVRSPKSELIVCGGGFYGRMAFMYSSRQLQGIE